MIINTVIGVDRLKEWTVTLETEQTARTTLITDNWLKVHRLDPGLQVIAELIDEPEIPSTDSVLVWAAGNNGMNRVDTSTQNCYGCLQYSRIKSDGSYGISLSTSQTATIGIAPGNTAGYLRITSTGQLQLSANTTTYRISKGT